MNGHRTACDGEADEEGVCAPRSHLLSARTQRGRPLWTAVGQESAAMQG